MGAHCPMGIRTGWRHLLHSVLERRHTFLACTLHSCDSLPTCRVENQGAVSNWTARSLHSNVRTSHHEHPQHIAPQLSRTYLDNHYTLHVDRANRGHPRRHPHHRRPYIARRNGSRTTTRPTGVEV